MQSYPLHTVDLSDFDVRGVAVSQIPGFHIVMQRQGNMALIEGRSGVRAEGFNHSTFFSCLGAEQNLRDLKDLLERKDGTVVRMRPASLEIHSGGHPITFRCLVGDPSLRLLAIGSSGATDFVREIILKDDWDRNLPASQAVSYFQHRLEDLLKDF